MTLKLGSQPCCIQSAATASNNKGMKSFITKTSLLVLLSSFLIAKSLPLSLRIPASDNDARKTRRREGRDVKTPGAKNDVIASGKLAGTILDAREKHGIARPTENNNVPGSSPKRRRQRNNGTTKTAQTGAAAAGPVECSRNVTFSIEQSGTANYRLVVSSPNTGGNPVEYTSAGLNYNEVYDELHKDSTRKFIVTFPPPPVSASPRVEQGNAWALGEFSPRIYFHVTFLDEENKLVWPTFVQELWDPIPTLTDASSTESISCPIYTSPRDIQILQPVLKDNECSNLIENGRQDPLKTSVIDRDEATETLSLEPWHHSGGGVAVDPTRGRNESAAFITINRDQRWEGIGQNLNTLCLSKNKFQLYHFQAWFKVLEENGNVAVCDPNGDDDFSGCPEVTINYDLYGNDDDSIVGQDYGSKTSITTVQEFSVAKAENPFRQGPNEWNSLSGFIYIKQQYADASRVYLNIERAASNFNFIIDDVSLSLVGCDKQRIIENGDFENGGFTTFWEGFGYSLTLDITEGFQGGHALIVKNRKPWMGASQPINIGCMEEGELIAVSAKIKLEENGSTSSCNTNELGPQRCPNIYLKVENNETVDAMIGQVSSAIPNSDGWYDISGLYNFDAVVGDQSRAFIVVKDADKSKDIVIDDFKVHKILHQCSSLVMNPSFQNGLTTFWLPDKKTMSMLESVYIGDRFALRSFERKSLVRGPSINLDTRCFVVGMKFFINASFKLMIDGLPASCDPLKKDWNGSQCPTVVLKGEDCPNPVELRIFNDYNLHSWDPDSFNYFEGHFIVDESTVDCGSIFVVAGSGVAKHIDIILGDFQVYGGAGASLIKEITLEPTSTPSKVPSSSPSLQPSPKSSETPSAAPSEAPSTIPTTYGTTMCPEMPGQVVELGSGTYTFGRCPLMCILTIADVDDNGSLSHLTPVARSFDNGLWRKSSGAFASSLQEFHHRDAGSQIYLPQLDRKKYHLRTYSHDISERDSIARFLNMATFGARASDIDAWSGPFDEESASKWIENQLTEHPTSHRAYFRKGLNQRMTEADSQFRPDHPCDVGSRWRKFTFSQEDGHQYWNRGRTIGIQGDGPYTIVFDGYARTTVDKIKWKKHWLNITLDPSKEYPINCWEPVEEWINGNYFFRAPIGSGLRCLAMSNPPVYFNNATKAKLPNPVIPLPADGLKVIDSHKRSNRQEFILVNGLEHEICDMLTDVGLDDSPPIFGELPSGTWLQFDPRLHAYENSLEKPLPDGGAFLVTMANGTTNCANVRRSLTNEQSCKISNESTACTANGDIVEGGGILVCGSPNEVSSDPHVGAMFSENNYSHRERVWAMIALNSTDQLRQRVAWAFAQLLVLVPDQIVTGWTQSEAFLKYYDILVEHAFGNYKDMLRGITFSSLMADNLSFLNSRSSAFEFESSGSHNFPDENFAREIMQLFSIGPFLLHNDGTIKYDVDGNPVLSYSNEEVMSMARVFTGFEQMPARGNYEWSGTSRNYIDDLQIIANKHDEFPKNDLSGGYIGDGYPLCVDLPEKMFLRKGATYRLLGKFPQAVSDAFDYDSYFVLENDSSLRDVLCSFIDGQCQHPVSVTLTSNLNCIGRECDADEIRVIQVGGVFYEYVRPPCVQMTVFHSPRQVVYKSAYKPRSCANPALPHAGEACCDNTSGNVATRSSNFTFDGERVTYSTAQERCEADGKVLCNFKVLRSESGPFSYHWTSKGCAISVKVNGEGKISIVYAKSTGNVHPNVAESNVNYFRVYWDGGNYPKSNWYEDGNNCGDRACDALDDGGCLCMIELKIDRVFSEMPASPHDVLLKLNIGAYDVTAYDEDTFTTDIGVNMTVYHPLNETFSTNSIFQVTDSFGNVKFLKNSKEMVQIKGRPDLFFRNAPSFMSVLKYEATNRDATNEVDAVLDHLFHHQNTAPFIAKRLIQRFTTSNPDPSYIERVSTAFRTGKYRDRFGSGRYGDLAATISAVLLEPDAQSMMVDSDPFQGFLREPLLKVISFFRSMELRISSRKNILELSKPFVQKIGQYPFSFKTVFSFFLSEYIPDGRAGNARLSSPEAMITDMPKSIGMLNGLFSTIKYGVSSCNHGFGVGMNINDCQEGDFSKSVAKLTFTRSGDADAVVNELSSLLTGGRMSPENKQIIVEAYNLQLPDHAAALRVAQQLIVASPEFQSTNTVRKNGAERELPESPKSSGVPYKAVIVVMLAGGVDSFNMVIPIGDSAYNDYVEARKGVAIQMERLLTINDSFGIHPNLTSVRDLFHDGDLLFFANTGVLTKPTDKTNYRKDTNVALFAHNWMMKETQHIDPMKIDEETGVLGRIADALISQRKLNVQRFNLYNRAEILGGRLGSDPFIIDPNVGIPAFNENESIDNMASFIKRLNDATELDSGVFGELWSDILMKSLHSNKLLTSAFVDCENTTASDGSSDPEYSSGDMFDVDPAIYGNNDLGKAFEMISHLITTREVRGVDRDFFFVPFGGWDAHRDVGWNLERNFGYLNNAIQSFSEEMKREGIWDKITILQSSEFGRTIEPNSGGGTDHGWGGNYMMMGGAVKGGQILGKYPEKLTPDGPDILSRGRVIPTTSWDVIFHSIAAWMGAPIESLRDICPNIGNFLSSHIFDVADLFEGLD